MTIDARIRAYLDLQGLTPRVATVAALTGDASDRRYYRVALTGTPSVVLAVHTGAIDFGAMRFTAVDTLMHRIPLPVPAVLHHSDALGIIGLEDLGDCTLHSHLATASDAERAARYREAIALIARLQRRGAELTEHSVPPYDAAFDIEKLTWELRFFVTHFLIGHRGLTISPSTAAVLDEEWLSLASDVAAEPRVVCHRDYHSRNLMLHDGRLVVIDHQDARMGPATYDLASLLRDSYVDLPDSLVNELIAYFWSLRPAPSAPSAAQSSASSASSATQSSEPSASSAAQPSAPSASSAAQPSAASASSAAQPSAPSASSAAQSPAASAAFAAVALQRNLKALGTFGYQASARGNTGYLQYVPRTLGYVRRTLAADPRFGRLRDVLAGLVAELG